MPTPRLRSAARALIVDDHDRLLLCRFELPHRVVWAAPGGGLEPDELPLDALRRELWEEVGLSVDGEPPQVWHQEVLAAGHAAGYDGVINDYFLLRTAVFTPRGSQRDEQLAAESITGFRWWAPDEIAGYDGDAVFSPRELGRLYAELLHHGAPDPPFRLGL